MVLTRHTVVQEGTERLPREAKMGRRDGGQAGEWGIWLHGSGDSKTKLK